MSNVARSMIARLCVAAFCLALLFQAKRPHQQSSAHASADVLRATDQLHWYKGNLHTHSLWSDGDDYLEMIADWYRDNDYQFLSFTDHNVLATTERWTVPEENAGKLVAYEKLKKRFPDWVEERTTDGKREVRLRRFTEVAERFNDPGKFLLIQGEEITDTFQSLPIHLNGTNVKELVPPMKGESVLDTINNNVNAVIAQRERTGQPMIVHVNHPNFGYGITAEELMRVRGERFYEVYNGHPGVNDSGDEQHASTERMWDIILTRRIAELDLPLMYGLATDDGHRYHNIPSRESEPGRGWVCVLAAKLSPATIIEAMEAGRFYSSSGVELQSVTSTSKRIDIAIEAEEGVTYTTEFIGTRRGYDRTSSPITDGQGNPVRATRRYSADVGAVLKTIKGAQASYDFDGTELYVRVRVTSSRPHPNPSEVGEFERAWIQPIRGSASPVESPEE